MKNKKIVLFSLMPLAAIPVVISSTSCTDKTTINGARKVFNKIKDPLSKLQLNNSKDANNYDLDVNDYKEKSKTIVTKYWKFELVSVNLEKTLSRDYALNEGNNVIETNRVYEFLAYRKSNDSSDGWEPLIGDNEKIQYKVPVKKTLKTINQIDTKLDLSKAEKLPVDWSKNKKWLDAEIVDWADGDTPRVKILNNPNNLYPGLVDTNEKTSDGQPNPHYGMFQVKKKDGSLVWEYPKIRIAGIDTPEKAVGTTPSDPFEYGFAEKSSEFAKKNFLPGRKVRLLTEDLDAFSRITADVFFAEDPNNTNPQNKDYVYSYATEITRAGLTLPYGKNVDLQKMKTKGSIPYYTFYALGKALTYAQDNRKGFFSVLDNPKTVSKYVYTAKPNRDYLIFDKYHPLDYSNPNNVFTAFDKWKDESGDPLFPKEGWKE
ncbi:MAG: hypothetical protein ACTTJO_00340 [Metamycoplasmataceae bacterium]